MKSLIRKKTKKGGGNVGCEVEMWVVGWRCSGGQALGCGYCIVLLECRGADGESLEVWIGGLERG